MSEFGDSVVVETLSERRTSICTCGAFETYAEGPMGTVTEDWQTEHAPDCPNRDRKGE